MKKTIAIVAAATMTAGSLFAGNLDVDGGKISNTIKGKVRNFSQASHLVTDAKDSGSKKASTIVSGIEAYNLNMAGGEISETIGSNAIIENNAYHGGKIYSGITANDATLNNSNIVDVNNSANFVNHAENDGEIQSGIKVDKAKLNSVDVNNTITSAMNVENKALNGAKVNSGIDISGYSHPNEGIEGGKFENNLFNGTLSNDANGKGAKINSGISAVNAIGWNNPNIKNTISGGAIITNIARGTGDEKALVNSGINLDSSKLGDFRTSQVDGTVVNRVSGDIEIRNESVNSSVNSGIFANNARISNGSTVTNTILSSLENKARGNSEINSGIQLNSAPLSHGTTGEGGELKYRNNISNIIASGAQGLKNIATDGGVVNSGIKMNDTIVDVSEITNTVSGATERFINVARGKNSVVDSGITITGKDKATGADAGKGINESTISNTVSGIVANRAFSGSTIASGIKLQNPVINESTITNKMIAGARLRNRAENGSTINAGISILDNDASGTSRGINGGSEITNTISGKVNNKAFGGSGVHSGVVLGSRA